MLEEYYVSRVDMIQIFCKNIPWKAGGISVQNALLIIIYLFFVAEI